MSIESLKEQARSHEQKEDWQAALDLYIQAIRKLDEADQTDIGLYNRVGDIEIRLGKIDEAAEHYLSSVDLYVEAELPNNAIAVCKKIIRNVPARTDVYLRMGQIRATQGFLTDARQSFLTYAEGKQQEGDLEEAFRALIEFADLAPDDTEIRLALAAQLHAHERTEEAVEQLLQARACMILAHRNEEAAEVEAKIAEMAPDTPLPDASEIQAEAVADPKVTEPDAFEPDSLTLEGVEAAFGGHEPEEQEEQEERETPSFGTVDGLESTMLGHEASEEATPEIEVEGDLASLEVAGEDAPAADELVAAADIDDDALFAPAADELDLAAADPAEAPDTALFGDESDDGAAFPSWDDGEEAVPDASGPSPVSDLDDGLSELEALADSAFDHDAAIVDDSLVDDSIADEEDGSGALDLAIDVAALDDATEAEEVADQDGLDALAELAASFEGVDDAEIVEVGTGSLDDEADDGGAGDSILDDWTRAASDEGPDIGETEELGEPSWAPAATAIESPAEDLDSPAVLLQQGLAAMDAGQAADGMPILEQAYAGFAERGQFEQAVEALRPLTAHAPDQLEYHQRMVEYAFQVNDRAVLSDAYLNLASCLERAGDPAKAQAVYQQVLGIEPENETARAALGQVETDVAPAVEVASSEDYVDLGALVFDDVAEEKTTRWFVEMEDPTGDDEADFAKMLTQFKEKVAEHLEADDVRAHYDLGTAYREMGLVDEAIAEFQQALRGAGDHLPTYEVLGQCFMEKGQYEVAIRSMSKALSAPYEVEDELLGIYYYLGRANEELGNPDSATEFYEKIFTLDINFRDVTERLRALR